MQKQIPITFSLVTDSEYSKVPDNDLVMVSMESSRSGKTCIRARGHWEGDLFTVVKDVPPPPEFNPTLITQSDYEMAECHYFWDWMRYGAVMAILEIALEDWIDYDDICHFVEMLEKPTFQFKDYKQPDYFEKLEHFGSPVKLKMIENRFTDILRKWR